MLLLCLFYSSVVGDYGLHTANRRPKKRYPADRSAEPEDRHDDDSGSAGGAREVGWDARSRVNLRFWAVHSVEYSQRI